MAKRTKSFRLFDTNASAIALSIKNVVNTKKISIIKKKLATIGILGLFSIVIVKADNITATAAIIRIGLIISSLSVQFIQQYRSFQYGYLCFGIGNFMIHHHFNRLFKRYSLNIQKFILIKLLGMVTVNFTEIQMNDLSTVTRTWIQFSQRHVFSSYSTRFFQKLTLSVFKRILTLFQLACRQLQNHFLIRISELSDKQQFVIIRKCRYANAARMLYNFPHRFRTVFKFNCIMFDMNNLAIKCEQIFRTVSEAPAKAPQVQSGGYASAASFAAIPV